MSTAALSRMPGHGPAFRHSASADTGPSIFDKVYEDITRGVDLSCATDDEFQRMANAIVQSRSSMVAGLDRALAARLFKDIKLAEARSSTSTTISRDQDAAPDTGTTAQAPARRQQARSARADRAQSAQTSTELTRSGGNSTADTASATSSADTTDGALAPANHPAGHPPQRKLRSAFRGSSAKKSRDAGVSFAPSVSGFKKRDSDSASSGNRDTVSDSKASQMGTVVSSDAARAMARQTKPFLRSSVDPQAFKNRKQVQDHMKPSSKANMRSAETTEPTSPGAQPSLEHGAKRSLGDLSAFGPGYVNGPRYMVGPDGLVAVMVPPAGDDTSLKMSAPRRSLSPVSSAPTASSTVPTKAANRASDSGISMADFDSMVQQNKALGEQLAQMDKKMKALEELTQQLRKSKDEAQKRYETEMSEMRRTRSAGTNTAGTPDWRSQGQMSMFHPWHQHQEQQFAAGSMLDPDMFRNRFASQPTLLDRLRPMTDTLPPGGSLASFLRPFSAGPPLLGYLDLASSIRAQPYQFQQMSIFAPQPQPHLMSSRSASPHGRDAQSYRDTRDGTFAPYSNAAEQRYGSLPANETLMFVSSRGPQIPFY